MRFKSVEFAGAMARPGGQAPPGRLPEIAFSGRSNVGKSSLINRLLGRTRHGVARVSARPGKTQQINFYRVSAVLEGSAASASNRAAAPASSSAAAPASSSAAARQNTEFFLVDLPGYSFARVPAAVREHWKPLIEGYLSASRELRGVVQLIDARHDPTADDGRMVRYLVALGTPTLFALTKIDKLGRSHRQARVSRTVEMLGVDAEQVIPFSATTGEGRESLLDSLAELLTRPQASPSRAEGES